MSYIFLGVFFLFFFFFLLVTVFVFLFDGYCVIVGSVANSVTGALKSGIWQIRRDALVLVFLPRVIIYSYRVFCLRPGESVTITGYKIFTVISERQRHFLTLATSVLEKIFSFQ